METLSYWIHYLLIGTIIRYLNAAPPEIHFRHSLGVGLVISFGASEVAGLLPVPRLSRTQTWGDTTPPGHIHENVSVFGDPVSANGTGRSPNDFHRPDGNPSDDDSGETNTTRLDHPITLNLGRQNSSTHTPNTTQTAGNWVKERSTVKVEHNNEFHSKSNLYKGIRDSIPLLAYGPLIKKRSCKTKCGRSRECSCKPICQVFNTCCFDFLEECGDIYDLPRFHDEYKWLKSVDTQCLSNIFVVSSCSTHKDHRTENNSSLFSQWSSFSIQNKTTDGFNTTKVKHGHLLADFLGPLLLMYDENEARIDDFEKVILSTPFLDTSTGISYRNLSVFRCNGASFIHALPWTVFVPLEISDFPLQSKLETQPDVLSQLDVSTIYHLYPYLKNVYSTNAEQCSTTAVASCPVDFSDRDIIEGCHVTNYFLNALLEDENSSMTVEYKNPFCLFCNTIANVKFSNLEVGKLFQNIRSQTFWGNNGLFLDLSQSEGNYGLALKKHVATRNALRPNWDVILCNFLFPADSSLGRAMNATSPQSQEKPLFRRNCQVQLCLYNGLERCLSFWMLFLVLPPAKSNLTDVYLTNSLETWRELLLHRFPGAWKDGPSNMTYYKRLWNPEASEGLEYRYSLAAGFYSEWTGYSGWQDPIRIIVQEVMMKINFPFQYGKNYVCVLYPEYNEYVPGKMPKKYACSKDNIIYVSQPISNASPVTATLALDLSMNLVIFLFFVRQATSFY